MDQRDIQQLYDAGQVATSVEDDDVILVGRKNIQRGDKYSVLVMDKKVLTDYIVSQIPTPPAPFTLPYKVYSAILSQSGTSAPTATVLQNTLGGPVTWSYNSAGNYSATTTGLFTAAKTVITAPLPLTVGSSINVVGASAYWSDVNSIVLETYKLVVSGVDVAPSSSNDLLFGTDEFIEIKVFN